ncbi:hypothetical protein [Rheinheimera sp. MMS21-TC3]|uniref:hypothetical protein n=1 Tax=Rheinheimera sp. MMS21-TC3 TaxID=3072790 RepID=UPI0028C4719B|nr:hypothetical protein [Rheinheimera sp. MMS21-TC3]WNO61308.1 hypothetical protein RDV63_10190 [Rheinheimera sp. MMS21-TC3]
MSNFSNYFKFTLVVIITALWLVACSDVPNPGKIEQALQQKYNNLYPDLIAVDDVKKINGWSDNEQHYAAEVSYSLEFKKSYKQYIDEKTAQPGNPLEKVTAGITAGLLKLQYGDFKQNDQYKIKQETLTFRMTENGWALVD